MTALHRGLYDGYAEGTHLYAQTLTGLHVGEVVSFQHRLPDSWINTVVIAEIRRILHSADTVILECTTHDEPDTPPVTTDFHLDLTATVVIMRKKETQP